MRMKKIVGLVGLVALLGVLVSCDSNKDYKVTVLNNNTYSDAMSLYSYKVSDVEGRLEYSRDKLESNGLEVEYVYGDGYTWNQEVSVFIDDTSVISYKFFPSEFVLNKSFLIYVYSEDMEDVGGEAIYVNDRELIDSAIEKGAGLIILSEEVNWYWVDSAYTGDIPVVAMNGVYGAYIDKSISNIPSITVYGSNVKEETDIVGVKGVLGTGEDVLVLASTLKYTSSFFDSDVSVGELLSISDTVGGVNATFLVTSLELEEVDVSGYKSVIILDGSKPFNDMVFTNIDVTSDIVDIVGRVSMTGYLKNTVNELEGYWSELGIPVMYQSESKVSNYDYVKGTTYDTPSLGFSEEASNYIVRYYSELLLTVANDF